MRVILLAVLLFSSQFVQAQYFQADFMKRKQANKESSRWTFTDWMIQKKKVNLMDMWLSANRNKNIIELDFGGGARKMKVKTETAGIQAEQDHDSSHYKLSFFVYMMGLQADYVTSEEGYDQWSANLNLRLLGSSQQNTRLNLKYGLRERTQDLTREKWTQQFAGAEVNLYITHFMGLEGEYKHFLKDTSNLNRELSGHESKAGIFFEYSIFRLFADYYTQKEQLLSAGVKTEITREGLEYGLKMYF